MNNTTATATMNAAEAALDALQYSIWDGYYLSLTATKFQFTKRNVGGYYVAFAGLRLGWVVKDHSNVWDFYTTLGSSPAGMGSRIGDSTSRYDACEQAAMTLTKTKRLDFLIAVEKRAIDTDRYNRLMAEINS